MLYKRAQQGYGLAVTSIDISLARLVPTAGAGGWLHRLPGAVVWIPDSDQDTGQLLAACLAAESPTGLLATVAARLADPQAAPWPPFAILVARGTDMVAVVHGPVEVNVEQDGALKRLFGGDEIGSWLNRLLRGATMLRAGEAGEDEGLADLRDGLIRASGFALVPRAGEALQASGADLAADAHVAETPPPEPEAPSEPADQLLGPEPVPEPQSPVEPEGQPKTEDEPEPEGQPKTEHEPEPEDRPETEPEPEAAAEPYGEPEPVSEPARSGPEPGGSDEPAVPEDESPTVVEFARSPVASASEQYTEILTAASAATDSAPAERPKAIGRLTWDNGQVSEILGSVLIGRDVLADDDVLAGRMAALVPGGQNDSMSRVHAELWPRGSDVVVLVDRGSLNGTFVWDDSTKAWQRLAAGEARELRTGAVVAFGERTATFEAAAPSF